MAVTYTPTLLQETVFGNKRIWVVQLAITAMDANGIPCTAAGLGLAPGVTVDYPLAILIGTVVAGGPVAGLWYNATKYIHFITATNAELSASVTFTAYAILMGS